MYAGDAAIIQNQCVVQAMLQKMCRRCCNYTKSMCCAGDAAVMCRLCCQRCDAGDAAKCRLCCRSAGCAAKDVVWLSTSTSPIVVLWFSATTSSVVMWLSTSTSSIVVVAWRIACYVWQHCTCERCVPVSSSRSKMNENTMMSSCVHIVNSLNGCSILMSG